MKCFSLGSFAITAYTTALAVPLVQPQYAPRAVAADFYLRANAPGKPWHLRNIVWIPSTKRLGLENFTVHPETPPVYVTPIPLANNTYALRIPDSGDGLSRTPYIAALDIDSQKTGYKTVHASAPTGVDVEEGCPADTYCPTDEFNIYQDGGKKLAYGGFEGNWNVNKDVSPEGWHIYWMGTDRFGSQDIEIELVPRVLLERREGVDTAS
ncbi:hypothetical protein K504DRAFT_450821 [Pleomassaria siparia CBS 279.74]|uniref:Ubiquitin 3 binding protein But2 C-terminal domain-containing protein n=1 Tax=Pleomassaria siparia CBS 279.74 TaxID=1314801 RepID=A0A6G1KPD6_9PLEO|nr:hypothetical protein K504DRAFT_450821 [Pleomassaria siparia CBS 279.74]